jgi:4-diphosphocytidyl-2-C-methyl-D-erythritol kinase
MTAVASGAVRVRACAKINLTLRVLGVRADGYHELRTTFQSLALHDTLTLRPTRGPFALTTDDPACPSDATNLVWKAADALWRASGRRGELSGVSVQLRKRIPSEAGLGGGSSDAAATLLALRALWRTGTSDDDLAAVARGLGADVPFFLCGGTVLGVERGDLLFPLHEIAPAWVVLARPAFGVSTRDAYRWWDEEQAQAPRRRPAHAGVALALMGSIPASDWTNDLQRPVVSRYPGIARLLRILRQCGAGYAAMSGSGSAVFALFAERSGAESAAQALERRSVRVWTTRTLSRREFAKVSAPVVVASLPVSGRHR